MLKYVAIIVLSSIIFVSCVSRTSPLVGLLVTNVTHSGGVSDDQGGVLQGKAKCKSILGLVSTGDCSIEAAKKAGGITTVSTIDYNTKSYVFGIYQSFEVIVTGK